MSSIRGTNPAFLLLATPLAFFVVGINTLSYPSIADMAIPALGISNTESGLLVSAITLTHALMQIPGGILSDRIGGEKVLAFFMTWASVFSILFPFSTEMGYVPAILTRAAIGLGVGSLLPSSVRLLSNSFSGKKLDIAMGVFGAGWGVSQVFVFTLMPTLVQVGGGWRQALLIIGGISLAASIPTWLLVKRRPGEVHRQSGYPFRRLTSRNLLLLVLPNLVGIAVPIGVYSWGPFHLRETFGIGKMDAGLMVATIGLLNVAVSPIGGTLTRAIGRKPVVLLSMALCVVGPLGLAYSPSAQLAMLSILVIGIGSILYFGPVFALVPRSSKLSSQNPGLAFGIFNTISNAGALLAPILMGLALDTIGTFAAVFVALTAFSALGLLASIFISTAEKGPSEP